MHSAVHLIVFFAALAGAVASVVPPTHIKPRPKLCKTLRPRLEWRMLDSKQKKEYTRAVGCLQHLPAQNASVNAIATRHDELQWLHISLADNIHAVGQFLPWHRKFTVIHETMLREECHYRGPIPYWDWSKDVEELTHMSDSPVFDSQFGFGGDGIPGTYTLPPNFNSVPSRIPIVPAAFKGCVMDGPFASTRIALGPGELISEHCLVRNINDTFKQYLTYDMVRRTMALTDFESFRVDLEGRPETPTPRMHDAAHILVGGDMSNFYSSVADPLFFLHHTNIDRIWWMWQRMDPVKRLYEITGRSTPDPPYSNITLDFKLDFGGLSPPVAIRDVMNIHAEPMCFTYV